MTSRPDARAAQAFVQPMLHIYDRMTDLPAGCTELFFSERNFAVSWEWFGNLIENGISSDLRACFGVLMKGNCVTAVVPLLRDRANRLSSLTNCYSLVYQPLISTQAGVYETAQSMGRALGYLCRKRPPFRIDCL